tara:strand:- start:498 stop:2195 length:1698 start_codon:yes stop_codon:yes gene_type:complete
LNKKLNEFTSKHRKLIFLFLSLIFLSGLSLFTKQFIVFLIILTSALGIVWLFEKITRNSALENNTKNSLDVDYFLSLIPYPCFIIREDLAIASPNSHSQEIFSLKKNYLIAFDEIFTNYNNKQLKEFLDSKTKQIEILQVSYDINKSALLHLQKFGNSQSNSLLAIVEENTKQKELEEQIYQNQKMQSLGQLAGGVAHDFNNILTAIIGATDLLMLRFKAEDPLFKEVHSIKDNAQRAAGVVRQLLAYSRQQKFNLETISITEVLEEQITLLNRLVGEKIKIDLKHEDNIWPVKADLNQLESVITNLVINARDAIEGKQIDGLIKIETKNTSSENIKSKPGIEVKSGNYVVISITDNGKGIHKIDLEKIFEPFYSTKGIHGTGLGLSMVYGIIKQLGGYIFVTSEASSKSWTKFDILIPEEEIDQEKKINIKESTQLESKDLTGSGNILIVEDEDAVRSFIKKALKISGYNILEAYDGVSAIKTISETSYGFDLIISDVMMPEMDGPTMAKKVHESLPNQRILFISGYSENFHEDKIFENKNIHFLNKPFTLEQLNQTVKNVIKE